MSLFWPRLLTLTLLVLLSPASLSYNLREYTLEVGNGREWCFFETLASRDTLDVEYQVIDGGSAQDFAIDLLISGPQGQTLAGDVAKSEGGHRITVADAGDYKFCFDNRKTLFGSGTKVVFFELLVEPEKSGDGADGNEDGFGVEELLGLNDVPDEGFDITVDELKSKLGLIQNQLTKSRKYQDAVKAQEFKDRSVAEHNFERVNFWSLMQVLLMLFAGFIQVTMLKSLFEEKSRLHALFTR